MKKSTWGWVAGLALIGAVQGLAVGLDAWWGAWLAWGAQFAVIEGYALVEEVKARKAGNRSLRATLSRHIWAWFGVNTDGEGIDRDVNAWARIRRVLLGGFLLWLTIHFLSGGAWA
jgi:hypothetical protein